MQKPHDNVLATFLEELNKTKTKIHKNNNRPETKFMFHSKN